MGGLSGALWTTGTAFRTGLGGLERATPTWDSNEPASMAEREGRARSETASDGTASGGKVRLGDNPSRQLQHRRPGDFYSKFTEDVLTKNFVEFEEGEIRGISESVERQKRLSWHRWVDLAHKLPKPSARLFCCPWAGGNSSAFDAWPAQLPGVEVIPLLLPGHLTRADECPLTSVADMATLVVDALRGLELLGHEENIPWFVFGHELGALLAFEMCRRFEEEFPAAGLFVSGMGCPQMVHERQKLSLLCRTSENGPEVLHTNNIEFKNAMLRRGGLPREVCENTELMEIFTHLWFADLSALDGFEYGSGTGLIDCPIYSFGGTKDPEIQSSLRLWSMESSSDKSTSTLFQGDIFFLLEPENEARILQIIHDRCRDSAGWSGADKRIDTNVATRT